MHAFKRFLLKPYAQIAAALLLIAGSWQLYAALAFHVFIGDCSPEAVAAHGDCVVYFNTADTVRIALGVMFLSAVVLGLFITRHHWWGYASVPIALVTASIIFQTFRTCQVICGYAGPDDLGGCPPAQICTVNPAGYLAWLIPLAAFGLAGYTLWRGHTKVVK